MVVEAVIRAAMKGAFGLTSREDASKIQVALRGMFDVMDTTNDIDETGRLLAAYVLWMFGHRAKA
jgi:hypothetical protein